MGLLYNINTERSWFMQMMTETSKDNSPYSAISKLICRKYNFNGNSAFRITNYLDEIANRYDKIPRNPDLYFTRGTDTYTFRGTQKKFIENFVELEKMQRVTIGVNLFDTNGWVFRKYVEDIVDAPNTYYANVPMSKWLLT